MARNLDTLLQRLEPSAEPGIDALDPRFTSITSLASHGQYAAAADQIEGILSEGIHDIRLLSIYLFQAFREDAGSRLGVVFAVIERLLGEGFEAVGPVKKRAETFDRRLAWLFNEIVDALAYHTASRTAAWAAWHGATSADLCSAVTASLGPVAERLAERALVNASGSLARLESWLANRADHAGSPAPGEEPPAQAAEAASTLPPGDASRRELALAVSYRFLELARKLRAFESLVEARQFRRAALVADDLQQIIEHFDPRSYFPEVFAGFSALLSENIAELAGHWEERESIGWKALGQFYQTDLERFVRR